MYQYRSLRSARRFAEKFFFSREVDLRSMIKFRDPKQTLLATVEKFGRERPVSRYVARLPVFMPPCSPYMCGMPRDSRIPVSFLFGVYQDMDCRVLSAFVPLI